MASILLGCIADDFTGATDLANNLVRAGMRVVQTVGVPDQPLAESVDAVVISLKSRTIDPPEAVELSLQALTWLRAQAAQQIYFKYCSTFDSTDQGNIGPVIDALMQALATNFTIAAPAFPDAGRTVFQGHLFVGDVLLNESGMQDHPLTPMADPNLLRVLRPQTRHEVGLVNYRATGASVSAIEARFEQLRNQGVAIAIADVVHNEDLQRLAGACAKMALVTGGSGLALGLPANFSIKPNSTAAQLPAPQGHRAIVCGSCSRATQAQIEYFIAQGGCAIAVDPMRMHSDPQALLELSQQASEAVRQTTVLIYSTTTPAELAQVQSRLGVLQAGELVERCLAQLACDLVRAGVGQLVVAGGETSGAVVQALGLVRLRIGQQIDPGVPWCFGQARAIGETRNLHISLKSGNFGGSDFFCKAFEVLTQ